VGVKLDLVDHELTEDGPPRGMWQRALWFADHTPEARNRYVDFLRALSILAVVLGHWLIAAPYFNNGAPAYNHLLDLAPWSQWLTWLFQVMPVFFFVGGFSNGISWESAHRKNLSYRDWFDARMRRLIGPVLPLLLTWGVMVAVAHSNGVSDAMIRVGSQVALVPVWFLAVYIMVVALVPLTHAAWARWGFASVLVPAGAAALVDLVFFAGGLHAVGWLNYPFVWLTVHQLGYAWHDGRLAYSSPQLSAAAGDAPHPAVFSRLGVLDVLSSTTPPPSGRKRHWARHLAALATKAGENCRLAGARTGLLWFIVGILTLIGLTHLGPYPLSLVGVPSDEISNTLPPKLPLLALAAAQIGLVLIFEAQVRRWLAHRIPWAVTILINGMIMTIFLWHSTVMMLLVGLAFWQMPGVLGQQPDTAAWWWTRPLWILAYAAATLPFLLVFARFERPASGKPTRPTAIWLQLLGCAIACGGLAILALDGVGGSGWLGLRWIPLLLPLVGAGVAGFGPLGWAGRSLTADR